jgi:hypothetical protein
MSNLLVVTQTESDELDAMVRRSVRPPPHGQAAVPPSEAIILGAVRAVVDASVAVALAGQPFQVLVAQGETVAEAERIIRGAVLLFHHPDDKWALFGDEAGELHLLDTPRPPQEIDQPKLVEEPARLLVDSVLRANGSRGIRYRTLQLRPFFARHTKMQIAFDPDKGIWYRSLLVEHQTGEPDPEASGA